MLAPAFAKDPERVDRLRSEARLLASLNHPHIAGIYGLVEAPHEQGVIQRDLKPANVILTAKCAVIDLQLEEWAAARGHVAEAVDWLERAASREKRGVGGRPRAWFSRETGERASARSEG